DRCIASPQTHTNVLPSVCYPDSPHTSGDLHAQLLLHYVNSLHTIFSWYQDASPYSLRTNAFHAVERDADSLRTIWHFPVPLGYSVQTSFVLFAGYAPD